MDCMQLRSPPGPFHYLISEQAKSLVALQELQNEVGALLEFRDLVIETFPNLRSKMSPAAAAGGARQWEPGVRVRRKLPNGDAARGKPQPSVQDSGFSTETSCGKDAHSSASASAPATRPRPLEDELWALLDVIQRKGVRLRDEAELLRSELDDRPSTAEESFTRALSTGECEEARRLRSERDALLALNAQLEAAALVARPSTWHASPATPAPLGALDAVLGTPVRTPQVPTPDHKKFAAILQESNPVELQRQLLTSTVQTEVLSEKLRRAAAQRTVLLDRLERTRDENDDLKFQLEEKTIELEGARAKVRQLEHRHKSPSGGDAGEAGEARSREPHSSMRDMQPLTIPDEREARIADTPRRRPSRIPVQRGPTPRRDSPPRPPSSHSARSVASARSRHSSYVSVRKDKKSSVPVRRPAPQAPPENKMAGGEARALVFD